MAINTNLRGILIGLGVQGRKRLRLSPELFRWTVDPVSSDADFKDISEVPTDTFDFGFCCVPDDQKERIVSFLVEHGKHVLVEKPFPVPGTTLSKRLAELTTSQQPYIYVAYNHRFEPHICLMKDVVMNQAIGQIYSCSLFYGNGTANLVKNSSWRDAKGGVLPDLTSHLLDMVSYWWGGTPFDFRLVFAQNYENRHLDYALMQSSTASPKIFLEVSLLQWKNDFACDLVGSKGSAHIRSLCKWGPSEFILRKRKLPSGKPDEESTSLICDDPTWIAEHSYFIEQCEAWAVTNLDKEIWIAQQIESLVAEAYGE